MTNGGEPIIAISLPGNLKLFRLKPASVFIQHPRRTVLIRHSGAASDRMPARNYRFRLTVNYLISDGHSFKLEEVSDSLSNNIL